MPELPEIEIVKRSLFKMINKARIVDIKINNKDLRYKVSHTSLKKLINKKILRISRRSKYLIFHFKNKLLLVHLGMSGKFLVKRKKNIKNLLMDQTFVSGLGNIYVNETLFLSKIHPLRQCNNVENKSIKNIISNIKKILKISINRGGSSIKDFKNIYGTNGNFQDFFNVYGRENKNCSRISCNGKIKKISISNRSSFYCTNCQY